MRKNYDASSMVISCPSCFHHLSYNVTKDDEEYYVSKQAQGTTILENVVDDDLCFQLKCSNCSEKVGWFNEREKLFVFENCIPSLIGEK